MERIKGLLWGIIVCILISFLTGCRSVQYVPIERVRTDSVYISDTSSVTVKIQYRDSIKIRDSIVIIKDSAGNIRSFERYRDEMRSKDSDTSIDKTQNSTNIAISNDSRQIPIEVEKPLNWWDKMRFNAFWWLAGVIICLIAVIVFILKKRP